MVVVVLRCSKCGEIILDVRKGINRITEIREYDIVFRDEIGRFELDLELVNTKYVCNYCGNLINTKKLEELGINISDLIREVNNNERR